MASTATATTEVVHAMLTERQAEIREEDRRIQRALDALATTNGRRPGRPRKALTAGSTARKAPGASKRSRKGGTRAEQAVKLIAKHPSEGVTATDIGKVMKIKPNYLYRVLGDLEKSGLIRKDGKRYFPPK